MQVGDIGKHSGSEIRKVFRVKKVLLKQGHAGECFGQTKRQANMQAHAAR